MRSILCRAESRGSIVTRVRLPFLALYSGGDGPFRKRVTNLPRRRVRMLPPMIGWGETFDHHGMALLHATTRRLIASGRLEFPLVRR